MTRVERGRLRLRRHRATRIVPGMHSPHDTVALLRAHLEGEPSVVLAFLFGSVARGRNIEESDVDVAVYLADPAQEQRICRDLTRRLGRNVDLVSIREAPATLNAAIFKQGTPLLIRDRRLYTRLYLEQTLEAEDFAGFAREYQAVVRRSASLSPEDETRLRERMVFLEGELRELESFRAITKEDYLGDKSKRRNLERWAENLINASIDIAKLVLAAEREAMPRTYQDALEKFARRAGVSPEDAVAYADFARLRNLLAHQYLEILYDRIRSLRDRFPSIHASLSAFLDAFLAAREE